MGDENLGDPMETSAGVEGDAVKEGQEIKEEENAVEQTGDQEKGDEAKSDQENEERLRNEEVGGEWEEGEEESIEGESIEGEGEESEYTGGDLMQDEYKALGEGEEIISEHEGEQEGEETEGEKEMEEVVEEEEVYEEPPVDPAAPYNFSDSNEALKAPFELRPDQLVEVETLWAMYQDYTPAYTDLKDYITEVELIYMLKCLLLMTYTPEQLQELIDYCVRPPNPDGHINYDQFIKMVTIRQRDMPIEEELRCSLEVMDKDKSSLIDREYMREVLAKQGHKIPQKQVDNLIKEVDMSNDGTIGIEDVVGTLCIDLNTEDLDMLRNQIWPPEQREDKTEDLL